MNRILLLSFLHVLGGTGVAAALGGASAAAPTISEAAEPRLWINGQLANAVADVSAALPDPRSPGVVMWLLAGLLALLAFLGAGAGAVLAFFAILDRVRGKRRTVEVEGELHTRPSPAGPTRVEFEHHVQTVADLRKERKEDVGEIKSALKEIDGKLNIFSSSQYSARARMHQRLNTLENAMWFWCGTMTKAGDKDAEQLRAILQRKPEEGTSHE